MAEWLAHFKGEDALISGPVPKKLTRRVAFEHERPKAWKIFESDDIED
jgi:hypothetical protein